MPLRGTYLSLLLSQTAASFAHVALVPRQEITTSSASSAVLSSSSQIPCSLVQVSDGVTITAPTNSASAAATTRPWVLQCPPAGTASAPAGSSTSQIVAPIPTTTDTATIAGSIIALIEDSSILVVSSSTLKPSAEITIGTDVVSWASSNNVVIDGTTTAIASLTDYPLPSTSLSGSTQSSVASQSSVSGSSAGSSTLALSSSVAAVSSSTSSVAVGSSSTVIGSGSSTSIYGSSSTMTFLGSSSTDSASQSPSTTAYGSSSSTALIDGSSTGSSSRTPSTSIYPSGSSTVANSDSSSLGSDTLSASSTGSSSSASLSGSSTIASQSSLVGGSSNSSSSVITNQSQPGSASQTTTGSSSGGSSSSSLSNSAGGSLSSTSTQLTRSGSSTASSQSSNVPSSGPAPGQSSSVPAGSATATGFNFGTPTLYTSTIFASGTTELVPILGGGSLSAPITLSPATTTIPATEFTSSAASASSQLAGLVPIITGWTNNPSGDTQSVISSIQGVQSEIEGLITSGGGTSSGGCGSSKRKRGLYKRSLIGDIVNSITGDLECAVAGLTKITGSINAGDVEGVDGLVDGLTSVADDIGNDTEDDNNSSTDEQSSQTSSQESSSTESSASSSSSCSAATAMHITSDCVVATITSGSSSTTTTTCTSSTTVETTGCSVTDATTTVYSSTSSSVPAQCETGLCGDTCNLNSGPATASMNAGPSDSCSFLSTETTDTLPTATQGLYGSLTIDNPSPTAAPAGKLRKRAYLAMDEGNPEMLANVSIRALDNPTDPQTYVSGLNPAWVNQPSPISGQYFPFTTGFVGQAGVNGIYGCTGVFVISEKGVFISHIWEVPVFSPGNWQTTDDAYFTQTAVQGLLDGTANSASLTALKGTDDAPGPLHPIYAPKVFVASPFTNDYGRLVLGITTPLHYQARANQIAQTLATSMSGSASDGYVFGYTRTDQRTSTGPGYIGRAILEVEPFERWLTSQHAPNDAGLQIGKWRLWVEDTAVAEQEYWVPNINPPAGGSRKRDVGYPNPCGSSGASSSTSASASSTSGSSSTAASSTASSSGSTSAITSTSSNGGSSSSSAASSTITSSASQAASYCSPFQDPDRGIAGYCQCSDGADYSFATGSNPCPYTSPGPSSLSIDPATVTGTVTQPSNPVPPITVVPSSTTASATSSAPPSPSSSLAAQCAAKEPVCQTSDGSPLISDCSSFFFQGNEPLCSQPDGSGCQTVNSSGGCNLVLCQPDDFFGTTECLDGDDPCIEYWIDELIDKCGGSNGRVGGYITIPASDGSDGYLNIEFTG